VEERDGKYQRSPALDSYERRSVAKPAFGRFQPSPPVVTRRSDRDAIDNPDAGRAKVRNVGSDRVKRSFDILVVLAVAPVWVPLLAVLALGVRCTSQGPAFYRQERVGRHGATFACVKLRTMVVDADARLVELLASRRDLRDEYVDHYKLCADPRVTRFGRLLRATGLDELPQLFQVLRGNMSIVGPRPIVSSESHYYGPNLSLVQMARPGLTGLWQVSGRNDTTYPERVAYDVQYVQTRSLRADLKIVARTLLIFFTRPTRNGGY
jgi:lipopolysaccharide/colanic/teichoic acid biosynthesis glycosyltransferase